MDTRRISAVLLAAASLTAYLYGCGRVAPVPELESSAETRDEASEASTDTYDDASSGEDTSSEADGASSSSLKYDGLRTAPNGELIPEGWSDPLEEGNDRGAFAALPTERFERNGVQHETLQYSSEPYGISVSFEAPYFRTNWEELRGEGTVYDTNTCVFDSTYPGVSDNTIKLSVTVDERPPDEYESMLRSAQEGSGAYEKLECPDGVEGFHAVSWNLYNDKAEFYVPKLHIVGYPHVEVQVQSYQSDYAEIYRFVAETLTIETTKTSASGRYPPLLTDGYGSIRYPASFGFDGIVINTEPDTGVFCVRSYTHRYSEEAPVYTYGVGAATGEHFSYVENAEQLDYVHGQKSGAASCQNGAVEYTVSVRRTEKYEEEAFVSSWGDYVTDGGGVTLAGYTARCFVRETLSSTDYFYFIDIPGQERSVFCSVSANGDGADKAFAERFAQAFLQNIVFIDDDQNDRGNVTIK